LFVDVKPGTSRFEPELSSATTKAGQRAADNAGPAMGRRLAGHIGTAIAAGTGVLVVGLAKGLSGAVRQASDLNETVSRSNVVFGKSGADIRKWAQNAASDMGQSTKAAIDGATTFAIYGKSAGLAGSDLFNFSTHLTGLASDMASFSNTSPEQAIEAIGAAMRGESDPIEKYGVLLNEAVLKHRALKLGIIDTTTQALSPQQRVLAVQAELYAQLGNKGSKALGDFERTQAGLANQTRISKAQVTDFAAEVGQSLLPVVTRAVTLFNTRMLPALRQTWAVHGPAVVAWLTDATTGFARWVSTIDQADISGWLARARSGFASATPLVKEFVANFKAGGGGKSLPDLMKVSGTAMGFLADHADLLAKAMPFVVAGLVAYKASQLAANVAAVAAPIATAANAVATRQLAKANVQLAASNAGRTATTTAATTATVAGTVATGGASVATRLFGGAIRFAMGPLGIIITVLGLATAAVIYLYKHNDTARRIIDAAWKGIKTAVAAVGSWFTGTLWPGLKKVYDAGAVAVKFMFGVWRAEWNAGRAVVTTVWNVVSGIFTKMRTWVTVTLPNGFKSGVAAIGKFWTGVQDAAKKPVTFVVNSVINPLINGFNKVSGVFGVKPVPTIGGFEGGGQIPGPPSARDNRWAWLRDGAGRVLGTAGLATGEFVVNARDTARALPLLQWINDGMRGGADGVRRRLGRSLTDRPGDGSEGWSFESGGLVGFLKDVWGAMSNPAKLIKRPIEAAMSHIPGGGLIRNLLVGMGNRLVTGLTSFLGGQSDGTVGTGVIGRAQSFLRAQNGKPYIWASAGPAGYDCSGIVSAVYNILHQRNPYSHTFSTGSLPGSFFPRAGMGGPMQAAWSHPGQRGASAGVGHMMGMVGGLTFESTGSRGVHLGATTRRLTDFSHIGHYADGGRVRRYDTGGLWPTGTLGVNTSGRTETVTAGQTMDDAVAVLQAVLAAIRALAPELAAAFAGTVTRSVQLSRQYGSPLKARTA
jgi:hypothetical protein